LDHLPAVSLVAGLLGLAEKCLKNTVQVEKQAASAVADVGDLTPAGQGFEVGVMHLLKCRLAWSY
jgi:hypothetical protein